MGALRPTGLGSFTDNAALRQAWDWEVAERILAVKFKQGDQWTQVANFDAAAYIESDRDFLECSSFITVVA